MKKRLLLLLIFAARFDIGLAQNISIIGLATPANDWDTDINMQQLTEDPIMDFNGESNTQAIVDQLQDNNGIPYAAKLCADLVAFGFDDWYLPAAGELHVMFQQLGPIFGDSGYPDFWSSTESSSTHAVIYDLLFGLYQAIDKRYASENGNRCRCVRK